MPITCSFGPMPIGKGLVVLITRRDDSTAYDARTIGFVAIYSAIGVRDGALNALVGAALQANPMPQLTQLRRELHEPAPSCWLHGDRCCLQKGLGPKGEGPKAKD